MASSEFTNKRIGGEYGSVRASIDVDNLNAYLGKHVKEIKTPVDVKQFKFGQSNPTYFLTDVTGTRFVLRKKPAGSLISKTAHQVEREYKMLDALHRHNQKPSTTAESHVPVPRPIILCEDIEVIGTPFYVMEYLDGRIFTDVRMPEISPADRKECWLAAIRALSSLSSIDPDAIGLSSFGPPQAYFPRQIKSLSAVSSAQAETTDIESGKRTGEIPYFDELLHWFGTHLPDERKTGRKIVHGDYKLDNLIFHPTENRVIGILDWELCTLGSPLPDLANLLMPWSVKSEDIPSNIDPSYLRAFNFKEEDQPAALEELEREYCRRTKQPYPIEELVFVRAWMLVRLAVIAQGIAARHAKRQASSERASIYIHLFPVFGKLARRALEREGERVVTNAGAKL